MGLFPRRDAARRHYMFGDAIVAIDRALRPAVLGAGTTFLDDNGPMEGTPVPMNLVIAADRAGPFDRYVAQLMGFPWHRVSDLRNAARLGDLPNSLEEIEFEAPPAHFRTRRFRLRRSLRNWIALSGFKSRFLTWFGYESWFGRVVLHGILYAIVGRPERPRPDSG